MRSATWLRRAGWLGAFAFVVGSITSAGADEPPKGKVAAQEESDVSRPTTDLLPRLKRRIRIGTDLINDVYQNEEILYSGKYTLQLGLSSVPKSLDAQLKLNGEGVLVNSVGKDGPAKKAGLEVHDILIKVADKPVEKMTDVIQAVNESEGKELTFQVLRTGKPIEVTVTPAVRSHGLTFNTDALIDRRHVEAAEKAATEATRNIELQLRDLENSFRDKLKDAGVDVRMQVIQPGRFLPEGSIWSPAKTTDFPDDLTIEIRKQGKEPAKIDVHQGDQSWTVTEDKLGELPEDVRRHVRALVGRSGARYSIGDVKLSEQGRERVKAMAAKARALAEADLAKAQEREKVTAEAARDRAAQLRERLGDRLERRLDEMSHEMKQMRQHVEELRRSLREPAADEGAEEEDDKPAEKGDDGEV